MGIVADAFAALEAEQAEPQYELVRYGVRWSPRRARVQKFLKVVMATGCFRKIHDELMVTSIMFGVTVGRPLKTSIPGLSRATEGFECNDPLRNVSFGYYLRKKSSRKELK